MTASFDVARIVVVALGLAWLGLLAAATMGSLTSPQRGRMIATMLVLATSAGTQWERLGEPPSWRLPVDLVACVLGIWATWMFVFRSDGRGGHHRPFRPNGDDA